MQNGDPRDRFFYPTLSLVIYSYNPFFIQAAMAGMSGMGGGMGGAGMGGAGGQGQQAQWMMTGPVIQRQVNEMCQNLLNVRNGYREMRDHLPYFVNPPGKAKQRFIDITETLYGYLTRLRVSRRY